MGKSTATREAAHELSVLLKGEKHQVLYCDLKRLTETQIVKQIFEAPKMMGWMRGEYALTVFLDSLDECWRRIDELESILVGELKLRISEKLQPFFLRLTCRSAEWRGSVGDALKELFKDKGGVQTFTLASLSVENIRKALSANGQDGDRFLEQVEEKGAQPLAAHPMTFKMLLQIYLAGGSLPASRIELYERGCLHLCSDPHSEFASKARGVTTSSQRLAIGARIAAISVLSNRYLINGDTERPLLRQDTLDAASFFGFFKEKNGGEEIEINRETVTETLQTALFSEQIESAQTWNHQSYAEFLAARYLAKSNLPGEQIAALMTDTSNNAQKLIPQLEETACWLVEMDPKLFHVLGPANIDAFIRCDAEWLSDAQKKDYAACYLDLIRKHESPNLDWQLKHQLSHLNHSDLANQLTGIILNRIENGLVRETAIDIAAFCGCAGLSNALLEVFLDSKDVYRMRQHAGMALERVATPEARILLKQKATPINLDDFQDEIKGYYLKILWPTHLSVADVLAILTPPKKRSYHGSYKTFIEYDFTPSVSEDELSTVLNWLGEKNIGFDILEPFGYFPTKIVCRALKHLSNIEVCRALMELIKKQENRLYRIFRGSAEKVELNAIERRAFWTAVVGSQIDIRHLVTLGDVTEVGILSRDDLKYFADNIATETDEALKQKWRDLVFLVFDLSDTALECVCDLAANDNATAEQLTQRTSCPLLPDGENWLKKSYLRSKHNEESKNERKRPSYLETISGALRAFETGTILYAFWSLLEFLQADPEKIGDFHSPIMRISKGDGWKSLPIEMQKRILAAVDRYFDAQDVVETDVWGAGSSGKRAYIVALPSLLLLYDEAPTVLDSFSKERWLKWSPVIFEYHDWNNGSHEDGLKRILSLIFTAVPAEAINALKRFIDLNINHDNKRRILWCLDEVWSREVHAELINAFQKRTITETAAHDLLQILIDNEPDDTRKILQDIFETRDSENTCDLLAPLAGALLLENWPEGQVEYMLNVFDADRELGKRIALQLVRGFNRPHDWVSKLKPLFLARLWDFLETHFEGDPYEKGDGGGTVTIAHTLYHFKLGIFNLLAKTETREACDAMVYLMNKRPAAFWMGSILANMRKGVRRGAWTKAEPKALLNLFADSSKILIKTAGDLHSLLMKSLVEYEKTLHGAPPSTELWNSVADGKSKTWDPKDENNFSDCLKRFFDRELERRGIIANREVQIRRRFGEDAAQLVDILVTAVPIADAGGFGDPVSVVVEVKCAWNNGVFEDMERQLYARYLRNNEYDFGIYVVGYFTCDLWNRTKDGRKLSGASRMGIGEMRGQLERQAKILSSTDKSITSIVIDARI